MNQRSSSHCLLVASIVSILLTLYGAGCVFIILLSDFLASLTGVQSNCVWMILATACLTPLTWLGTPKDSWPVAVVALSASLLVEICVIFQTGEDVESGIIESCQQGGQFINIADFLAYMLPSASGRIESNVTQVAFEPHFPAPTFSGYVTAFGTTMYAYAGMSTFPTIQADTADKSGFKYSAAMAYLLLFIVYVPLMAYTYLSLGDCLAPDVIETLNVGIVRRVAEILLMTHLVTTLPIIINAANLYFENLFNIEPSKK